MPDPQIEQLVEIGPFEGWDTWSSPWHAEKMSPHMLTDLSFVAFDESLGGVVTPKGRTNLFTTFTNPQGLAVFYRTGTGQAYAVLVANGVWKLIDYINGVAPVNFTLPGTWNTTVPTYFSDISASSGISILLATNGVDTPLKVRDDFTPAAPVATRAGLSTPLTAPTLALGGAGNLNGTYRYRVTFASDTHESSPGPISLPISPANQSVNLTAIATSSDPACNKRLIWRLGGSVPEWRLVGTINDNVTTTANDNLSDLDLGRVLDFDRDPIPAGITVTIAHKSRVFGFIRNNLLFSNFDEPEGWDPTNEIPCGKADDIITLGSTGSILLIFKRNQTFGLFGETIDDFIRVKLFDVGCVGPRAVASAPGEVYWLADDGLRKSNGQQITLFGARVYTTIRDLPNAAKETCVMAYGSGKLLMGFPDASPAFTIIYDLKTDKFEKYPFAPEQAIGLFAKGDPGFFAFTEFTTAPTFDLRRWPGTVFGDLGAATSWFVERKFLTSGFDEAVKVYRECELVAPRQSGIDVTVTLIVEDDVSKTYTTTVTLNSGPIRFGLPANCRGTYINVRISGSHSTRIELQKVRLYGWIERRYGHDKF